MRVSSLLGPASLLFAACGSPQHETPAKAGAPTPSSGGAPASAGTLVMSALALPGGGPDGIGMAYLVYTPRTNTVWVPAGNTGSVDVIDVATGKLSRIEGFSTQEIERRGAKRRGGARA